MFPFKHEYFYKTSFPHVTKLYNKLPPSIIKERDILEFKSIRKQHYKYKKIKHFCSREISKYANSLHTKLRLGRSYRSAHWFSIGLNKSALCICSTPETTKHFFICSFCSERNNKFCMIKYHNKLQFFFYAFFESPSEHILEWYKY